MIQKYKNSQTLRGHIFHILQYFATKLDNCVKFRMFFPAVLIDFPNSKVCLIGERSIVVEVYSPLHSSHFLPVVKEEQWHISSSILFDAQVPPRHGRPKQGSCNHILTFQEEGRHETRVKTGPIFACSIAHFVQFRWKCVQY